jgi:hypothetical protein
MLAAYRCIRTSINHGILLKVSELFALQANVASFLIIGDAASIAKMFP